MIVGEDSAGYEVPRCETTPVCTTTLLAPDFARLDDHSAPLGTNIASPHIASPALAGWTPRLTGKEDDAEEGAPCPILRSIERASLAAATAAPALALPIESLATLPLPALLHTSFLSVSLHNSVSEFAKSEQPQTRNARTPHVVVKVEATSLAGSKSAEPEAGMLVSRGGGHPAYATLTADGVAAALATCSNEDVEQQQQLSSHIFFGSGGKMRAGTDAAPVVAAPSGDELSDHRLTLEFLEENGFFDMPIQQAAAELRVGVTTLKKVCRVNNIGRWPFRKRSSLNRLIEKTREYFAGDAEQCSEALAQLEAQRSVLRAQQGEDIPESVKRYRQSIFKLDYKVKCAKRTGKWRPAGECGGTELLSSLCLPIQPPSFSPEHS